jgi:cytosine/adenosine deaminase-related metal-dependent hydrolase
MNWVIEKSKPLQVFSKLEGFVSLADGWHYGGGKVITKPVRELARRVLETLILHGFASVDVFPNEGGEVLVAAQSGNRYISVLVDHDQQLVFNFEIDKEEKVYFETCKIEDIVHAAREASDYKWRIYDSCIRQNSILLPVNSTIWHSLDQMIVGCQSSSWNVPKKPAMA